MNPSDYRKQLTQRIINQLEQGTAPWQKPWDENSVVLGGPRNAISERLYHGGNRIWLDCHGYSDPRWCTYKQAQEAGWQVRRGEKSVTVEYWQWEKDSKDEQGAPIRVKLEVPKVFYAHIFNLEQMDNVPPLEHPKLVWSPEESADQILRASGAKIYHDKTDQAFYSPHRDEVHLPPPIAFPTAAGYYATALHELGHWSGHESRLDRDLVNKFGSPEYAKEELRAELASYFLASQLGIPHNPQNHAAYVSGWIKVLQNDQNEIFRAAKDAEKITEFILEFQKERTKEVVCANHRVIETEEEIEC